MTEFRIERLSPENLSDIYSLYRTVYGRQAIPGSFHRKYTFSVSGTRLLGHIAYAGGTAVAFAGLLPVKMSVSGHVVLAAQIADVMTAPAHRRRGLFVCLMRSAFELAQEHGVHFVFGFPNMSSFRVSLKQLQLSHHQTLNRYAWPFKDTLLKKIKRQLRLLNRVEPRPHFGNSLLLEGFDGVIYDKDYVDYKRYNRNFFVQVANGNVWLSHPAGLWVGSMPSATPPEAEILVHELARLTGASSVTIMVSPGTALSRALSDVRQAEEGFPVVLKNFTGKYSLEKLKFQFADMDVF